MSVVHGRGITALRYRRALTRTAVSAAAAGLPVVPGAWWSPVQGRFQCDLPGCKRTGPHPAVRPDPPLGGPTSDAHGLGGQAIRDPEQVAARWRRHPYAVLVPTGGACDVVDVPAAFGATLAARLADRSALGPVIAAGTRWFFLTAPGGQLSAFGGEVLVHGLGSWIVLPPSLGPGGTAAVWLAKPGSIRSGGIKSGGWALPPRDDVIRGFADAAGPWHLPMPTPAVLPAPRRQSDQTSAV